MNQRNGDATFYWPSSSLEAEGLDELPELHDSPALDSAGLGEAQLGAACAVAGASLASWGSGAAGLRAGAAFFFAAAFLGLAFLADFFGAAAFDLLADFFADFLAFFADFFADFFEDFFADFFFAVRSFFLFFLAFLPPFFFLPLAIVILLLPPIKVCRAFQVVRFHAGPIDQFNPGRGPPVAQSRSSIVCTTGTDVPPAI
jgi:hypothetical protein